MRQMVLLSFVPEGQRKLAGGGIDDGVAFTTQRRYVFDMSTVAEIENALEQLPTQQMLAVTAWLDERRAMLSASETMFYQLDEAEGAGAGKQWLGK